MRQNFTVGVDIDGVLRDWSGQLSECWENETGQRITPEMLTDFDLTKVYRAPGYNIMDIAFNTHAKCVSLAAKALPGAVPALTRLYDDGIKVVLLSHQWTKDACGWTTQWLVRHGIPFNGLFYLKTKQNITCDLYVDDGPRYLQGYRSAGKEFVIFDALYNREELGPRVSCWNELEIRIREAAD